MIMTQPNIFIARQWQSDALQSFIEWRDQRRSGDSRTFTSAITGGAGKTHFGAMVEAYLFTEDIEHVVIICPSNTIANQWIQTMSQHDVKLSHWNQNQSHHGDYVMTYHMMNNYSEKITHLVGKNTLVIFDECHHLADSQSWGDAARLAAKRAGFRLMLTATPFREDDAKIPFVTYKDCLLVTNYQYSYGDALKDKYVRPVYFKALDADSQWRIDDNLSGKNFHAEQTKTYDFFGILNAAIDSKSQWLKTIIEMAHLQLTALRRNVPDAGGIITCRDQPHARKVHRLIQKITHTNPILAISDDADSDNKIDNFRDSQDEWLVVVRKGSEGLDIPRLQVGVWATNITKQLSFTQFLLRLVRVRENKDIGKAYFFMPAHPLLIEHANSIREMRVHALNEEPSKTSETQSRQKTDSSTKFESVSSLPGELTEIEYTTHPDDTLDLLIRIRELAAGAIDDYARQQAEISLNAALYDIRNLLNIPVKVIDDKTKQSPVDDYERDRQWRVFLDIFHTIINGKPWWRDILSFIYKQNGGKSSIIGSELAQKLRMPEIRFGNNWKRDLGELIDTGLIRSRIVGGKRVFINAINLHLKEIAPDHDTEKLVGYLLTGKLGDQTHA